MKKLVAGALLLLALGALLPLYGTLADETNQSTTITREMELFRSYSGYLGYSNDTVAYTVYLDTAGLYNLTYKAETTLFEETMLSISVYLERTYYSYFLDRNVTKFYNSYETHVYVSSGDVGEGYILIQIEDPSEAIIFLEGDCVSYNVKLERAVSFSEIPAVSEGEIEAELKYEYTYYRLTGEPGFYSVLVNQTVLNGTAWTAAYYRLDVLGLDAPTLVSNYIYGNRTQEWIIYKPSHDLLLYMFAFVYSSWIRVLTDVKVTKLTPETMASEFVHTFSDDGAVPIAVTGIENDKLYNITVEIVSGGNWSTSLKVLSYGGWDTIASDRIETATAGTYRYTSMMAGAFVHSHDWYYVKDDDGVKPDSKYLTGSIVYADNGSVSISDYLDMNNFGQLEPPEGEIPMILEAEKETSSAYFGALEPTSNLVVKVKIEEIGSIEEAPESDTFSVVPEGWPRYKVYKVRPEVGESISLKAWFTEAAPNGGVEISAYYQGPEAYDSLVDYALMINSYQDYSLTEAEPACAEFPGVMQGSEYYVIVRGLYNATEIQIQTSKNSAEALEVGEQKRVAFEYGDRARILAVEFKEGYTYELSFEPLDKIEVGIIILGSDGKNPIKLEYEGVSVYQLGYTGDYTTSLRISVTSAKTQTVYIFLLCYGGVPSEVSVSVTTESTMYNAGRLFGLGIGLGAGVAVGAIIALVLRKMRK